MIDLNNLNIKGKAPVFIHIPKTGGRFTKHTMHSSGINLHAYPIMLQHYTVNTKAETKFNIIPNWRDYETDKSFLFTVVRNPFDLLVSWYFAHPSGWGFGKEACDVETFTEFIHKFANNEFKRKDFCNNVFSQCFDKDGIYVPTITIRNEFLKDGLAMMLKEACNIDSPVFPEPGYSASKLREHRDWKIYYTSETRQLVENKCTDILKDFGYTFDGPTDNNPIIFPYQA